MPGAERQPGKKDSYSEQEAAEALDISVERLRRLLDEHVFNDGRTRPRDLVLRASDLVLISFWHHSTRDPKVVRMPRRP